MGCGEMKQLLYKILQSTFSLMGEYECAPEQTAR
jgi:hypothetical protein